MNALPLPFNIEPMTVADIPGAVALEEAAYTSTRPKRDYLHELEHNRLAHYFTLRIQPTSFNSITTVISIAGFWLIADELHLITIATHPRWQRLGLGEWLLIALLEEGISLGAQIATLEVRPSNYRAISLYQKYHFQEIGRRLAYYSNNGEDALILTTPPLQLPDYQAMLAQRKSTLLKRLAQIKVDKKGRQEA